MAKRTPPFPFGNNEHLSIVVEDLRQTVRFYKDLFGFTVAREMGNNELGVRAVVLTKHGRSIELFEYVAESSQGSKRREIVRGKNNPPRLQAGIRGIAFRAQPEPLKSGRQISSSVKSSFSAKARVGTKPLILKDRNGVTLRNLGNAQRRKKPLTSAVARPAAGHKKRKVKQ